MRRYLYNDWFYARLREDECPACGFSGEKTIDENWACMNPECRVHVFLGVPEQRFEDPEPER